MLSPHKAQAGGTKECGATYMDHEPIKKLQGTCKESPRFPALNWSHNMMHLTPGSHPTVVPSAIAVSLPISGQTYRHS